MQGSKSWREQNKCRLVLTPPTEGAPIDETFEWWHEGKPYEIHINPLESDRSITYSTYLSPGLWDVTVTSETGKSATSSFRVALDDPAGKEVTIRLP